jgi:hypothetical protein
MARRTQDDDPYAALIPGQQAEDDPYAALIPKQPTAAPTATTAPKQFGKGLARSAAQGLAFGFGEELEALPYLLPGGETREEALKRIRGEMSEYRQTYPKTAIGAELVGGLATGLAGGARALAAKTGASLARRGAAAAGRMALGNVGSSAIGGAGAAEGGLEDRLKGAATGAAIGVALPFGLGVVGKAIPEAARRRVTEGAATVYGKGLRGASDLAQQVGLSRVARALEPQDAIRAQQTLARQLPGSMEGGLTVESLGVGTDEAEQALRAAREEVSAAAATEAARAAETEAARSAVSQARAEGTARLTASKAQRQAQNVTAREQARLTEEIATPRQEKLTARAKQLRDQAKQEERRLKGELSDIKAFAVQDAEAAAARALQDAKVDATSAVSGLRAGARGQSATLQDSIRKRQTEMGQQNYAAVREIGAPPEVDPTIYREIAEDPTLAWAKKQAVRKLTVAARRAPAEATIPRRVTVSFEPPTGMGERAVSLAEKGPTRQITTAEVSLEMFDLMRREVMGAVGKVGPNATGIPASQRRAALAQINELEERFLNGYADDAAREAIKTARGQYRAEFELLEALQLGLGLGGSTATRAGGILRRSPRQLDEVQKAVAQKLALASDDTADDGVRAAAQAWVDTFRTGARESFDQAARESPGEMLAFVKRFQGEAAQDRLRLAFGDDVMDTLRPYFPERVAERVKLARELSEREGEAMMRGVREQLEVEPRRLLAEAERAEQLAAQARARASGRGDAATILREQNRLAQLRDFAGETEALVPLTQARAEAIREGRVARTALSEARERGRTAKERLADLKGQGRALRTTVRTAVGNRDRARELVRILPSMAPEMQERVANVMGTQLQDRIDEMAANGASFAEIERRLAVAQRNPAVRALMGAQINEAIRELGTRSMGARVPSAFGTSLRGGAARLVSGNLYRED